MSPFSLFFQGNSGKTAGSIIAESAGQYNGLTKLFSRERNILEKCRIRWYTAPCKFGRKAFGRDRMRKKRSGIRILLWILTAAVFASCASIYISYQVLTVSRYEFRSGKLTAGIRVVLLTDLHNNSFGRDNVRLTEKVRREEPDLIVICGDLLNRGEEDTSAAADFIRTMTGVAPVYVSYGNHEKNHEEKFGSDFAALCASAGATVLEDSWEDLTVNGQRLRLGGIFGYCLPRESYYSWETWSRDTAFVQEMQETDALTLLLCHMPVSWISYGGLNRWDIDVVVSGHAHGGQVRFPWIGGLYAPDQGWFPGREAGVYLSRDGERALVLSRGLGSNWVGVPRFNNPCEIVTLDLLP